MPGVVAVLSGPKLATAGIHYLYRGDLYFADIPPVLRTTSLESQHADADMHGIGEMTLPCVAPALANALYDALGIRIRTLPLTAERILQALQIQATPAET